MVPFQWMEGEMSCPDGLIRGFAVTAPESAAICYLKSYFGIGMDGLGVYVSGTGMLVASEGPARHVVTAAHNVWRNGFRADGSGKKAVWTSLWFRRSGETSLATRDVIEASFPKRFRDAPVAPADCDYAILRVNALGADRFSGITLAQSTAAGKTEKLLIGYPNEDDCKGKAAPWHARFNVEPSGPSTYRYEDQPTYAGMSGGPLLTRALDGTLLCWGIHIRGGDAETQRAIRFSAGVLDELREWL
jgi:hypothetical protein